MHSPVSTQALAHLRDASGPSPVFRMSMMPAMTATGSALTPPGPVTGQTSTHLPQRVQASAIAATRSVSAVSNVTVMRPRSLGAKSGRDYSAGGGDETPPGARSYEARMGTHWTYAGRRDGREAARRYQSENRRVDHENRFDRERTLPRRLAGDGVRHRQARHGRLVDAR